MALNFRNKITGNTLTVIIVFVAFISSRTLGDPTEEELVNSLCNTHDHPINFDVTFCVTIFMSNPVADVWAMEKFGIATAQKYTNSTIDLVTNLKRAEKLPEIQAIYDTCLRNYAAVADELISCDVAFQQKNYRVLYERARAATDMSAVCDSSFKAPQTPEHILLKTTGDQMQSLYFTLGYIAQRLGEF